MLRVMCQRGLNYFQGRVFACYLRVCFCVILFFFFSSRRRHTRCSRDWSSDVCSSDLHGLERILAFHLQGQGSGNGCPGTLTLKVEREYSFQTVIDGTTFDVVSTRVSLSYPYRWHFNRVIQFVAPGASYAGVTQISTDAIVSNMD